MSNHNLYEAVCNLCKRNLGRWISEERADLVVARHQDGHYFVKCTSPSAGKKKRKG